MKILSRPEGDGLLTNAEVHEWLKEKNFTIQRSEVPEGIIKPPSATSSIAKHLLRYLQTTPSAAQTTKSSRLLFERLKKFNLSNPELMMIANIRPEAYAHLTVLIPNVHSRYDDDQIYEILEIVNNTLEKRVKQKPAAAQDDADEEPASQEQLDHEEIPAAGLATDTPVHAEADEIPAETVDMTAAVQPVPFNSQGVRETANPTDAVTYENGLDATTTDYSVFAEASKRDIQSAGEPSRRMTR